MKISFDLHENEPLGRTYYFSYEWFCMKTCFDTRQKAWKWAIALPVTVTVNSKGF